MVLPPPVPPQARSPMGPGIEGGHDDVGTGPKCARPRLLRIRNNSRRRPATRQRERKGASEGSERATACAHEGESTVEVLNRKARTKWDEGVFAMGYCNWEGRHPGNQLATLALQIAGVLGNGETGRLHARKDSLLFIPPTCTTQRRL